MGCVIVTAAFFVVVGYLLYREGLFQKIAEKFNKEG